MCSATYLQFLHTIYKDLERTSRIAKFEEEIHSKINNLISRFNKPMIWPNLKGRNNQSHLLIELHNDLISKSMWFYLLYLIGLRYTFIHFSLKLSYMNPDMPQMLTFLDDGLLCGLHKPKEANSRIWRSCKLSANQNITLTKLKSKTAARKVQNKFTQEHNKQDTNLFAFFNHNWINKLTKQLEPDSLNKRR